MRRLAKTLRLATALLVAGSALRAQGMPRHGQRVDVWQRREMVRERARESRAEQREMLTAQRRALREERLELAQRAQARAFGRLQSRQQIRAWARERRLQPAGMPKSHLPRGTRMKVSVF